MRDSETDYHHGIDETIGGELHRVRPESALNRAVQRHGPTLLCDLRRGERKQRSSGVVENAPATSEKKEPKKARARERKRR